MKRNILIALMFALFVNCFADEFELDNIPKTHYGIWIPKEFDNLFKKDCNYISALKNNKSIKAHDILIVTDKKIQSDSGFHDGYAIEKSEFNMFKLEMNKKVPKLFDGNNNEYILINNTVENYTNVFENYLISQIDKKLKTYNPEKAIYVKNNKLYIQSRIPEYGPYILIPDLYFLYRFGIDSTKYNFLMYDENKDNYYGVILDKNSIEVDVFIEKIELVGKATSDMSVESVRAFSMK
jgi:hypothetical protein